MSSYGSPDNIKKMKNKKANAKRQKTIKKNKITKNNEQIRNGFAIAEKWKNESKVDKDGEGKQKGSD